MKNKLDNFSNNSAAPANALEPVAMPPKLHVDIAPIFPPSSVKFGPTFEDLARRSAPGSATSEEFFYRHRD
jgi:hypothetical protein